MPVLMRGRTIIILPGYAKNKDTYFKNNRIKTMILRIYNSNIDNDCCGDYIYPHDKMYFLVRLHFKDEFKYHTFNIEQILGNIIGSDGNSEYEYRFYIESVYPGSKYNDTCISEIAFY